MFERCLFTSVVYAQGPHPLVAKVFGRLCDAKMELSAAGTGIVFLGTLARLRRGDDLRVVPTSWSKTQLCTMLPVWNLDQGLTSFLGNHPPHESA